MRPQEPLLKEKKPSLSRGTAGDWIAVAICVLSSWGGQRVPVHRGHVKVEEALHAFSGILTFCGRQDLSLTWDMAA